MFHVPNEKRVRVGKLASDNTYGNNGMFMIPIPKNGCINFAQIIASDGLGWEHVSVVMLNDKGLELNRAPTWDDMCKVKAIFWDDDDNVVQFHPPKSEYVNNHAYCLHLWRPTDQEMPLPPSIMVGNKKVGQLY